jgi:phage gp29-like protein
MARARSKAVRRRAPASSVEVISSDIISDLPLWLQFQRIGGSLTPQQVSAIITQADCGRISSLVDLANEARQKDGHLHSVLQTRELALKGLKWSLEPPEDSTQREKKKAKDVEAMIRGSDNFPDLIVHLNGSGNYHGHGTSETMFKVELGRIVPERFKLMSARRFIFRQTDGQLAWSDESNGFQEIDLLAAFPNKFIQYQPRVNGDVPAREGLSRLLVWAALFRNWTLRDWLQLAEIGWKPQRLGKYKKEADKKDIEALKNAIKRLIATGTAALPETVELETTFPANGVRGGATGSHKELFDTMGAEMGKAVLGQNSTTEQGKDGSRASDQVRAEVRADILISDAISEAAALTRHLVRPLYALNYGTTIRPSALVFHTEDSVDLVTFSEAVKNFNDAGLRVPSAWIRRHGGMPDPKDGEEVIGEAPAAPDQAGNDGQQPPPKEPKKAA